MLNSSMDAVLHNPRIPTLPMVAVQVLRLTREANVDLHELAQIVQNDQALAIKFMRTVNSSYYGLARPCASINQAVVYLGLNAAKALVLGFSLVESIDGRSEYDVGFDYVDYWRRALYTAAAAREIAASQTAEPRESCDSEEAFLAALVQDVGMIALYRTYGDIYLQVIDMTKGDHRRLVEFERNSLRTDHAAIGAALVERWRFAPQVREVVRSHHDHERMEGSPEHVDPSSVNASKAHMPLVRCVQLAGQLVAAAQLGDKPSSVYQKASEWFGISACTVDDLIVRTGKAVPELARLFQVDAADGFSGRFVPEHVMSVAEDLRVEHEVSMSRELDRLNAEEVGSEEHSQKAGSADANLCRQDRDALLLRLGDGFHKAAAEGTSFALVLLEVDGPVRAGETSCDARIRERLNRSGGPNERAFHIEPGRFAIMLPESDRRHAARKAESLRRNIETEVSDEGQRRSTVSIGIATIEPALERDVTSAPKLLQFAEKALDAARQAGGNCVRVFSPASREKTPA